MFGVIRFERSIVRLMKMDQDRHDLAWLQLSWVLALFACGNLGGFQVWRKAQHEIIDIAKQFQYTHF
jgi:hypothetical protein